MRILSKAACLTVLLASVAALAQVPISQQVIVVMDENSSFSEVMANMPWLVGEGNAYGFASNYKSDNGGSLLDYLWIASGSCHSAANCTLPPGTHDFNCNGNDCYYPGTDNSDPISDNNIFRILNEAGIPWKVYAQSYAAAGGTITTPDNGNGTSYYRRHNGATWYSDVLSDVDGSANNVVDLAQLAIDEANHSLPRFSIIVPDGNHDAHDCPLGMQTCTEPQQLQAADKFLSDTLTPILNGSNFQPGGNGLLFVTFDECGGGTDNGCGAAVYAAVIGPNVNPHTVSTKPYKHENILRTVLKALGQTQYPGGAANVASMSDFFLSLGSRPNVALTAPLNNTYVTSPATIRASAYPTAGNTISGWIVYVDQKEVYNAGAVAAIQPAINLSSGPHSIIVRAWDTSGAYGDQTISVTATAYQPEVNVATPSNGANAGTPVNLQASASPTPGQSICGWWVYSDGIGVYSAGTVASINANLNLPIGRHSLLVRAWDTSGVYGDQSLTLTISNQPSVDIALPLRNLNVVSPFQVQANGFATPGNKISGWGIYLDGPIVYQAGATNSISTNLTASPGAHSMLIRTWDTSGAYGDETEEVEVQTVAANISTPFTGAMVNSPLNIRATASSENRITGWYIYVDLNPVFQQNNGSSVNTNLALKPGTHSIIVRAWDTTGAYGDQTITVTVP